MTPPWMTTVRGTVVVDEVGRGFIDSIKLEDGCMRLVTWMVGPCVARSGIPLRTEVYGPDGRSAGSWCGPVKTPEIKPGEWMRLTFDVEVRAA